MESWSREQSWAAYQHAEEVRKEDTMTGYEHLVEMIADALDTMPADSRPSQLVNRDRATKAIEALRAGGYHIVGTGVASKGVARGVYDG